MSLKQLETDYLIIGSGAVGMAFADVLLTETDDVFQGDTIVVQTVRSYQPVFSAAFIAHIEASYDDDLFKNDICQVVPLPNHDTDWIMGTAAQMKNQFRWSQEDGIREWLLGNRLDGFTQLVTPNPDNTPEQNKVLMRLKEAAANLPKLISEAMMIRQTKPYAGDKHARISNT